ncbi:DUF4157 domain-containing protein [Mucilaginibacter sp. BJC16-A38]|uniref:eCIS core domain-containing protein n=1 Tax=Mucilaginibacter phenanthrenivorans TaxID=1234842 RepID=UPI0021576565|nr:DUF4157 domain-containing protein [Mucilaginibacter phenanthrenivorans]MCR8557636.1 DUF4157 domain-containing protein [Mucilaginibacter phenanthrenivorans]
MEQVKHMIEPGKAKCNAASRAFFQPRLSINQPNDVYEQEADAMADKVMRMADPAVGQTSFFKPANNSLQRKCSTCEEDQKIQRMENSENGSTGNNGLDSYVGSLNSSGQSLPESCRQFFEPRFGHDFSNVKLHTDSVAAKSAQSINALAYTTGNNIVFNSGQYSPDSDNGKKLMAHELTHVVQQSGGTKSIQKAPATKSSETNQSVTETISNAPASASSWNKTITWNSKFQIVYDLTSNHITIVSRLFSTASDTLKAGWKGAIESVWGKGQFNLEVWQGCEPKVLPIDVDIQWVTDASKAHYTITPNDPGTSANGVAGVGGTTGMTHWGTGSPADVPHEYGHMLGNPEEYFTTNGIDYTYGGTKSGVRDRNAGIMNNPSEAPMPKHYESVRTGFATMMLYQVSRLRIVPAGTNIPPLINCGDGPKNQGTIV